MRTGLTDDTGIFASCTPQDSDPAGSPTLSVFSETGSGGIQVTVDKNLIRAPLAIVTQQESGDGHIEMSAGSARFLDEPPEGKTDRLSRCAVEASPQPAPDTVFVKQGRTDLKGKTLVYDESDGVARIDGPITFERSQEPGKPDAERLSGNSERIEVNVDKETTTLVGTVVLKKRRPHQHRRAGGLRRRGQCGGAARRAGRARRIGGRQGRDPRSGAALQPRPQHGDRAALGRHADYRRVRRRRFSSFCLHHCRAASDALKFPPSFETLLAELA